MRMSRSRRSSQRCHGRRRETRQRTIPSWTSPLLLETVPKETSHPLVVVVVVALEVGEPSGPTFVCPLPVVPPTVPNEEEDGGRGWRSSVGTRTREEKPWKRTVPRGRRRLCDQTAGEERPLLPSWSIAALGLGRGSDFSMTRRRRRRHGCTLTSGRSYERSRRFHRMSTSRSCVQSQSDSQSPIEIDPFSVIVTFVPETLWILLL